MKDDVISRQDAIDALEICDNNMDGINCHKCPLRDTRWDGAWYDEETTCYTKLMRDSAKLLELPSAQPEIIRCKDCKYWRRQTNYAGALLTFGFCESEDMWASLYGETYEVAHIDTDDNHYCGYAERRTDE